MGGNVCGPSSFVLAGTISERQDRLAGRRPESPQSPHDETRSTEQNRSGPLPGSGAFAFRYPLPVLGCGG